MCCLQRELLVADKAHPNLPVAEGRGEHSGPEAIEQLAARLGTRREITAAAACTMHAHRLQIERRAARSVAITLSANPATRAAKALEQDLVANGYACARAQNARAPIARKHQLQRGTLAEQAVGQPRFRRAELPAFEDEALRLAGNGRGVVDLRLQIGHVVQACAQSNGPRQGSVGERAQAGGGYTRFELWHLGPSGQAPVP